MKLAIISDKISPFFTGGYEIRLGEFARRLAAAHEVHVYTSLPSRQLERDGVFFHSIVPTWIKNDRSGGRSPTHSIAFTAALLRCPFAGFSPDVTLVESIPYLHLVSMARWAKRSDSSFLVDVDEVWTDYRRPGLTNSSLVGQVSLKCMSKSTDWAEGQVAISGPTARTLHRQLGKHSSPPRVIPLGYEPRLPAEQLERLRASPEYDIVSVGRLVGPKRHSDLVRALGLLSDQHGWKGRAAILGSGPLLGQLRAMVRDLKLTHQVDLPGFVPEPVKERILASSRVFVLPSEREGFSLATLEAMASGCVPIVARPESDDVFGVSDLVVDGVSGRVYPVGEWRSLGRMVDETLSNVSLLERLGGGAVTVARRYRWSVVLPALEQALTEAMTAKAARRQQSGRER